MSQLTHSPTLLFLFPIIHGTVYLLALPGRPLLVGTYGCILLGSRLLSTGGNAVQGSSKLKNLSRSPDSIPFEVLILLSLNGCDCDKAGADGLFVTS